MKKILTAAGFLPLFFVGAISDVALAPAHATPNADRTEEILTCNVLDSATANGESIKTAVQVAWMGIQGDTGMGSDATAQFLWKSVDDYCPQYRSQIEAWSAHR
jgi:hypothetical protein